MSAAKHTPGPWQVSETVTGRPKVISNRGFAVCGFQSGAYDQMRTDARLIAAAPELLAALKKCAKALQLTNGMTHAEIIALGDAERAIAKATGEQA